MIDRLISFLVALSLAFLVWLYARSRNQETLDNVPIPVQIELAQGQVDHYDLEVNGPSQIQVSFTGPPSRIRELRGMLQRGEVRVEVTLAVPEDRQGESRYLDTVRVDPADVHVPPGVIAAVVEGRNRIPVSLNRLVERRLPVRIDQSVEDRLSQVSIEPTTVLVRGPQEILERARSIPTQPYALPAPADAAPGQETTSKALVPLAREMEGRPVRPVPGSVLVRVTVRPRQKVHELADVPVRFLCPANFPLRPQFVAERAGKVTVRVQGPAAEAPPAVTAFIDLTNGKFEPGLYADEPLRLQLPKEYQLAQEPPRSAAFELLATDLTIKGREAVPQAVTPVGQDANPDIACQDRHPDPHLATARMQDLPAYCEDLGRRARAAARLLATSTGAKKNRWLQLAADALESRAAEILKANALDVAAAVDLGLTPAQIDRLRLNPERLRAAATGLREVAALADPVGRVLDSNMRPNGLQVLKVGVPLGVIFFIYESRPNVTVDAAALCVKSGNAIILRGGKEALHSNTALHRVLQDCLGEAGLPPDAVQLVTTADRAAVGHLLRLSHSIDLVIPRGGESLIRRVAEEARMPVLKHYKGNCHVYVDCDADLDMAERILINAKCQRPGVCNAAESLLVHRDVAESFLPRAALALRQRGVELRGCEATRRLVPDVRPATEDDFAAEYLDLILSVKVVGDLEEAIDHIGRYGSQHTETIVTNDLSAARRFTAAVDSSAVLVNASTRFNDGYEFGLGAEIGISTDKFHARGPCGLLELTSYKYVVYGDGQVRG